MPQETALEIYTIGHGNATAEAIIELLRKFQIEELVDVRSVPYSQYSPQFNRPTFEETLRKAGVAYRFAGEHLGGRPDDPTCYKDGALPSEKLDKSAYLNLVDYAEVARRPWYQKGIERLLTIAQTRRTAIMCSEEDPKQCHRSHLIAQTLVDHGVLIQHIRKNGDLELQKDRLPQQLTLF